LQLERKEWVVMVSGGGGGSNGFAGGTCKVKKSMLSVINKQQNKNKNKNKTKTKIK
jgi:putative sterol carrier protein